MSLWTEMADDAPEFLEEFGRPIVFRTQTISALLNRTIDTQMLTNGGFTYGSNYAVRILAPDGHPYKTDKPTHGEFVTIFGKRYTVTGVTVRSPDPWIDLQVELSSSV